MFKIPKIPKHRRPAVKAVVDETSLKRFTFQSPIPIPLEGSTEINKNHITLDEKRQLLEKPFSFQPPIPIPWEGSSAMMELNKARITLDGNGQRFSFQSPIPIPLSHHTSIPLEKEQPLKMPFHFQPPSPLPSNARLAVDELLATNRLFEAFHKARITMDEEGQSLVEHCVRHCIKNHRFKVLAELSLNEDEEQMVYRLLEECGSRQAETVQLILLLQKNKYIEAVHFMESLYAKREMTDDDALKRLMSTYRSTMSPVTKGIAEIYLSLHGKLDVGTNEERRWPLSWQLARQKPSDINCCIFSALCAELHSDQVPMRVYNNVPFLRTQHYGPSEKPQRLRTVRPVPYQTLGKGQSELKEAKEDSSSKRFPFQPPTSLSLDHSSPVQSGGRDLDKEIAKVSPHLKALFDGSQCVAQQDSPMKVSPHLRALFDGSQLSGVAQPDSPMNPRMRLQSDDSKGVPSVTTRQKKHKPVLEVIEEEGSLDIPRRSPKAPQWA